MKNSNNTCQYTFTSDIRQWIQDHAQEIADHLWAPNIGSGWNAWIYPGTGGTILSSYNTQNTWPGDSEIGDQLILPVWTEIDDECTFDDDYTPEDYITEYIYNGGLDIQAGAE